MSSSKMADETNVTGVQSFQDSKFEGQLTEDEADYCATCRPCCTLPHGRWSAVTGAVATVAWIFSLMVLAGCHFMKTDFSYCTEPKPLFGTCGDCHCARFNDPCPTGGDVPFMDYSRESVEQWKLLTHTNPMNITCNPYKEVFCEATPPQVYLEEWEDAVCGIKYDYTNLDPEFQCPTQYETVAYPSITAMEQDGANLTHYGTCGVCSGLKDLAVYVENPDLTATGQTCGLIGLVSFDAGIKCFEKAGYTYPCARMWMYNVLNTRDACFDTCIDFTFEGDPNNGPPPECPMADCLQCDEDESGPFFKKVAARTRRRSGLLSKIARRCDEILIVNHTNPCPPLNGNTQLLKEPEGQCYHIEADVGPVRYAQVESNLLFDLGFLNSRDTSITKSFYTNCAAYNFKDSVSGFWDVVQNILGAPWAAAAAMSIIALVLGSICTILVWTTMCAAYKQNFWNAMCACYALCGICQMLVLVFRMSDVCPDGGCEWLKHASFTIVGGIFYFAAAVCARLARGQAKPGQTIACACCPTTLDDDVGVREMAPLISGKSRKVGTKIKTMETVKADGTRVTEKVTTNADGTQTLETITTVYEKEVKEPETTKESSDPKDETPTKEEDPQDAVQAEEA